VEYADSILSIDLERPSETVASPTSPSVLPKITLSPTTGEANNIVTVSGTGFGKGKEVIIYFSNTGVVTTTTDTQGNFNATFNVLELAAGIYNVDAKDEDDNTARAKFTIIAPSSGATPATPSTTPWWLEPQWLTSIIIAGLACIVGIIRLVIVLRRRH